MYEVADQRKLVAKIYHHPARPEKAEKLIKMVELKNERLLRLAAWPVAALHANGKREVAGILMQNASGLKDIHLLYSPKSRIREFPARANWPFLIHAAANVARAFSVVHEQGHVIGDVNQSNIRVSPESATVNLVDCDSFQVFADGKYYLCDVGVPLYTPPELQEKSFNTIVRTANHDNFGLAVLVFHLLFMGRHPFAGRFLGRGEMPIEKAIYEFRFAYDPDAHRTQMQVPPNSLTLKEVSPGLADLFMKAFSPVGVKSNRPYAKQWVEALTQFERELKKCDNSPAHFFFRSLSYCPWCGIESRAGVLLFVGVSLAAATGFNLGTVWLQIESVSSPGTANLPDFAALVSQVQPSARAKAGGRRRRFRSFAGIGIVLLALVFGIAAQLGGFTFWIVLIAIGIASKLPNSDGHVRSTFQAEQRAAASRLRGIQERWAREASDQRFTEKLKNLRELKKQYSELPFIKRQKLADLQKNLYEAQLQRYLERFPISTASIPHIGDGRKAMLASYGIDTAADVSSKKVDGVPGFGQFLTSQLISWRRSLEARFVFDPKKGIDPDDIREIDKDLQAKQAQIEKSLLSGVHELKQLRSQILATREILTAELKTASIEFFQAQANLRAS